MARGRDREDREIRGSGYQGNEYEGRRDHLRSWREPTVSETPDKSSNIELEKSTGFNIHKVISDHVSILSLI